MIGLSPAEERATRDAPGWVVCSLRPLRYGTTRRASSLPHYKYHRTLYLILAPEREKNA